MSSYRIVSRFFAVAFAVFLGIGALLVLPLLALRRIMNGKTIFRRLELRGAHGSAIAAVEFNTGSRIVRNLPLWNALLTGKISLCGVSRRSPSATVPAGVDAERPGFFTMEFIRRGSRVAYAGRDETDLEYLSRRSFRTDAGIVVRTLPALLFAAGADTDTISETNCLFGLEFDNLTMTDALDRVFRCVEEKRRARVAFVNPDCFNKLWHDTQYRVWLDASEFVFPDGIGLVIAGKLLRRPLRENVNGTDMFPFLCKKCADAGISIYLLGAGKGVAQKTADVMTTRYPALRVAGVRDGFFASAEAERQAVADIAQAAPGILFVAMGVPRQERFLAEHWGELSCTVGMGVGGLFDFYSGRIPRAPKWMRECGLEWTFRLAMEPVRMFRRYIIGNPVFLFRVLIAGNRPFKR